MKKKRNPNHIEGLITREAPKSVISEIYRTIRTNIDFSMIDEKLNSLVITSSHANEGKTTTASNLAITFAQTEKKVLLIDADLRRPTLHNQFKLQNQKGLTNVIAKQESFEKAVVPSGTENLWILPSGPIPPNPAELLGSNSMAELLKEALAHFDLVIFDMPPLLAVTDAQILGRLCDGVLLVVRSHQTKKEDLIKAKDLLDKAQVRIIGSILHGVDSSNSNQYYYYG